MIATSHYYETTDYLQRQNLEKVENHIRDAEAQSAKVLCGKYRIRELDGYFTQPIIISDMTSDMLTTKEEIFGQFLGLYKFETEDEV